MTLANKKIEPGIAETFAAAIRDYSAAVDSQVELAAKMSDEAAGEMSACFEKLLENLGALTESLREVQSHRDRLVQRLEAEEKERAQRIFYANDMIVDELVDGTEGAITQLMMHGQSQDAIFQILTCVRGYVGDLTKLDVDEMSTSVVGAESPRRLADAGTDRFVMQAQKEVYAKALGLAFEDDEDDDDLF